MSDVMLLIALSNSLMSFAEGFVISLCSLNYAEFYLVSGYCDHLQKERWK